MENDPPTLPPEPAATDEGRPPKPPKGEGYPPELREQAKLKREHDPAYWTHKRIGEDLGVNPETVRKWVSKDGTPKPRGRPKTPKPGRATESVKARTAALEAALTPLLTFPAVPSALLAPTPEGRAFLSAHFTSAGPRTAHTLAVASESSPDLRELLEGLTKGSIRATIAFAVLGYVAPPVLWMFGMQGPAMGLSQAVGLDEQELVSMFQAQAHAASPVVPEPDSPAPPAESAEAEPPQAG